MKSGVIWLLVALAAMWIVELINGVMGHQLNNWGILPRTTHGLTGIPLMPFLHGNLGHLLSNTIPFLILGGLVALRGQRVFLSISLFIIVVGGGGVWAVGRTSFHVGASGLVFGYFGYLVARGWYDRKLKSILTAVVVLVLYGGLIFGVLPTQTFVSWEAHLFGMIAGVLIARLTIVKTTPTPSS